MTSSEGRLALGADTKDAAFETLVARLPVLYPWARRLALFLAKNPSAAEDLVQDALLQAVKKGPQGLTEETLRAWLRVVMIRLNLKRARRAANELRALLRLGAGVFDELPVSGDTHDMLRALSNLPPRQRACIVLHYLEDQPEDEIARVLGIAAGTVRAHLAQGRSNLRKHLEGLT